MNLRELEAETQREASAPANTCTTLVRVRREGQADEVIAAPVSDRKYFGPDQHLGAVEDDNWGYDYGQMFY